MKNDYLLRNSENNYQVVEPPSKVVIGMSGGVDSSVAAWLLKQQGYDVIGLFMKNWEDDDDSEYCSTRQDWIDVVSVADLIGIDVEAVNFATEYKDRVFSDFLREYSAGRTPNPDVLCNAEIKFKAFLDHAMRLGADAIATGHYARVRKNGEQVELLKATDLTKDQSYFLHRLNQQQLSRVMFPLGSLNKTVVREIAEKIGLPNAKKKDSTGICFIGERPFREFLSKYLPSQPGPMKTPDGKTIGEHIGLAFYTLGQRKGIGLGGSQDGSGDPWFVARKDLASNTLVVVQGHQHPLLYSKSLKAQDMNWVSGKAPNSSVIYGAKTRYRQEDAPCRLNLNPETTGEQFSLDFNENQWAVTPGQSAVVYLNEVCLGGGIIV
ncbi:tRNA 2-thiouridine(34) synthase MnmA [Polynucleobacter kasalickyi]|uniref:tRNA-specific 2-thiouridylase MnmA n=1 Tax=Polynucleobacter kasalickyi TaxID=1938817 RepID=A0A1W1YKB5_9BURK|nr:tRNA 2-thiouridine(34) synthase MnmA [Polynucleobacter kasalickyi]SMC36168.1 tRNA (5-methylaminomethyl-2-thiouridylate)-methyltransferase [Polynucleobacter kasalickyi]